jgi:class 3 adenylate cyclase/tetratricopeptide (TPR) repeat protein
MNCPRCQAQNRDGARFCRECGATFGAVCSSCGATVEAGSKFCDGCGAPLAAASVSSPGPSRFVSPEFYTPKHIAEKILTSKSALEGERKQVTVLFADLKGSMELLADRDPEDARKILDPVLERMMEAVHRYEGTVNQVMGDGIMALFGAPLAHEDHAVRACYAALRMQESVKRYAAELRRTTGVPLAIRVGMNSGEVVVRSIGSDLHMDYTAVGQTTHLAARMEQAALPGTIVVTADTLRLAEGFVEVKSLGAMPVKGMVEPVDAYELIGGGLARTRFQASATRGLTRFVGRDVEVDQLHRALERAAAGRGQVVAIVGEAGVGKSRLFYEFTHSHRVDGWLIVESGSVSYGKATTYLPVIDLLKGYFKIENRDDQRQIRDKVIGRVLGLDRALEPHLTSILALLDVPVDDPGWGALDPPQRRQRTLDAVKRLLLRESQVQPLLLVIEDLHWIDSETQALLDSVADSLGSIRALLLVNYRPEYENRWGKKTYHTQIRLQSLPPESTDELLRALLGDAPGLEPLEQMLRRRGNPFFLEETVRTLVETKALEGARGAYRLVRPVNSLQIPATVQATLAARIDRLSPDEKQLLQTASVIGKDVPSAILTALSDLPEEPLRHVLGQLQESEFLYETTLFPDVEYTFKHALTHEVTYGSLLQDRRRSVHGQIVEIIERLYSDRLPEHIDRLAHHAFKGEVWEKALTYLRQAGGKAFARSSNREALAYFEQALTALGHLPETHATQEQAIDVRFELRHALFPLSEFARTEGYLREAEALARSLDDRRRLAWVSGYMCTYAMWTGLHANEVGRFARTAEAMGETLHDLPLQVAGQYYLCLAGVISGDYRSVHDHGRRLLQSLPGDRALERLGLAVFPTVMARVCLARTLAERGLFEEGEDHGREAIRISETLDHPFSLIWACLGLAHLEGVRGNSSEAARLVERAVALGREWNITTYAPIALASLGHMYAHSGRVDEGLSSLEQALTASESTGTGFLQSIGIVQLGEGYLLADKSESARAAADRALTLARQRGERGHEAWALRLLGEIATHQSDVATAERQYAAAMALASELEMRPLLAHCHLGLATLHRRTGKQSEADAQLATATSMYREMRMTLR